MAIKKKTTEKKTIKYNYKTNREETTNKKHSNNKQRSKGINKHNRQTSTRNNRTANNY